MKTAYTVIASGKVQAVGFRRAVQQIARERALVGTVRNLEDGNVEVIIQGEDSDIEAFLGSIRLLSLPIKVANIEKSEREIAPDLTSFKILHGDVGEEIDEGMGAGVEELKLLRGDLNEFRRTTKDDFRNLAERYDSISGTLAKVVEQSAASNNELKRSMETLVNSLENLTTLAKDYFRERVESENTSSTRTRHRKKS